MLFTAKQGSCVWYNENYEMMLRDYYEMIVETIKQILETHPEWSVNVELCPSYSNKMIHYHFGNENKTIMIAINFEHTLVAMSETTHCNQNGSLTVNGTIKNERNGTHYLVRVHTFEELNQPCIDIVIDYAIANVINVRSCPVLTSLHQKHMYVAPSLYEPCTTKDNRPVPVLTTFFRPEIPRRQVLIDELHNAGLPHVNVNNVFSKQGLQQLLRQTKILINIHQTACCHTLEELRVLPALECGVIVIAERSPLTKHVPYADMIVWTEYENVTQTVRDVLQHYDEYHERIFANERVAKKVMELKKANGSALECMIGKKVVNES